ncbi:MAG: RNA polymerase sigma factor [Gemmatimonadota bacterium]
MVARVLAGETACYAELVRRHFPAAFAAASALTARAEDAEDVCQDGFARAYFRLHDCRNPSQFRAWLMQIVRRRAHNVREYQALRTAVSLDAAPESAGRESPGRDVELAELSDRLRAALATLPVRQYDVVRRHAVDGWTHPQISQSLGISVLMSRKHLSDARRRLRALLIDLAFEEAYDD